MRHCMRDWRYTLFFAISTVEGVEFFSASRFGHFATQKMFLFLPHMMLYGHQCRCGSSGKEKDVCPVINRTSVPRFTPASCRRTDWVVEAHVLEIGNGEVFKVVNIQVLGFCVRCGIAWYLGSEVLEQPIAFLSRTQYWGSIFAYLWNVYKILPKYTLLYPMTSQCEVMSCDVHISTVYWNSGLRGWVIYMGKKVKGKGHLCTGTEALYRPYGP
jgi:hypothetical protein